MTSHSSTATNGHVTAAAAQAPTTSSPSPLSSSTSASSPPSLFVLVVTPITAIVKELQSRLSTLPDEVQVEVADTHNETHLDEQLARCNVIYGEPKEIANKLHVSTQTMAVPSTLFAMQGALPTAAATCITHCFAPLFTPCCILLSAGHEAAVDSARNGWN